MLQFLKYVVIRSGDKKGSFPDRQPQQSPACTSGLILAQPSEEELKKNFSKGD
jgi:hypothetical protein